MSLLLFTTVYIIYTLQWSNKIIRMLHIKHIPDGFGKTASEFFSPALVRLNSSHIYYLLPPQQPLILDDMLNKMVDCLSKMPTVVYAPSSITGELGESGQEVDEELDMEVLRNYMTEYLDGRLDTMQGRPL